MTPWEILGKARAPDGEELTLARRGDELVIRIGGRDLMSSRLHGSEEEMARVACAGARAEARVLVGGLGLGYTLRATLDSLGPAARVVVAEIVPAVLEWNRGPLAHLAARPLFDPRVAVEATDVGGVIRRPGARWDAILLDVDNGPVALTRKANQILYTAVGLEATKRALRPGGVLAVWSASPDDMFAQRLRRAGFKVEVRATPARGAKGGSMHTVFYGRL
jgi:spermidine synthase